MTTASLSRRERSILEAIVCSGDDIDVAQIAEDLGISQNTLRAHVKRIRAKLQAPAATVWMEHLPAVAVAAGVRLADCGYGGLAPMPDDGVVRVDGTDPDV